LTTDSRSDQTTDRVEELGSSVPPSGPPPRRRAERERRRRRNLLVAAVLAALLLPFLIAAGWFVWELDPPGDAGRAVQVEVQPGWGAQQTGDELKRRGVIGSSLAFQIWAQLSGTDFQAGVYEMHEHLGVREAASTLREGPTAAPHLTLALPPGLTLSQIADRVGELPGHNRDAFLAAASSGAVRSRYQPAGSTSLEGLTWPDTYFIGEQQTDQEILQTIVSAFDEHASEVGLAGYDPVVVASLVQAEAGSESDAPLVSAVIGNRLARGMPLQIDATLCYAKGGCPPVPNNADKQIDSPHNTYRVTGLPPTPIMTVTEPALRAALHPANVPYLYYVTGDDGVTRFARTLAEHDRNIREHGVRGE
jgi:UPF0755 protein